MDPMTWGGGLVPPVCGHPSSGAPLPHAGSLTARPLVAIFYLRLRGSLLVESGPPVTRQGASQRGSLWYRAPTVGWPRRSLSYIIPNVHCCFLESSHPLPLQDHRSFCNPAPRVLRTRAEQSKSQWWGSLGTPSAGFREMAQLPTWPPHWRHRPPGLRCL